MIHQNRHMTYMILWNFLCVIFQSFRHTPILIFSKDKFDDKMNYPNDKSYKIYHLSPCWINIKIVGSNKMNNNFIYLIEYKECRSLFYLLQLWLNSNLSIKEKELLQAHSVIYAQNVHFQFQCRWTKRWLGFNLKCFFFLLNWIF